MADERKSANLGEELIRQDVITREDLALAQQRERDSGVLGTGNCCNSR